MIPLLLAIFQAALSAVAEGTISRSFALGRLPRLLRAAFPFLSKDSARSLLFQLTTNTTPSLARNLYKIDALPPSAAALALAAGSAGEEDDGGQHRHHHQAVDPDPDDFMSHFINDFEASGGGDGSLLSQGGGGAGGGSSVSDPAGTGSGEGGSNGRGGSKDGGRNKRATSSGHHHPSIRRDLLESFWDVQLGVDNEEEMLILAGELGVLEKEGRMRVQDNTGEMSGAPEVSPGEDTSCSSRLR